DAADIPPSRIPRRQILELRCKHDGLDGIHPTIPTTSDHSLIFFVPSILSKLPDLFCNGFIPANDCPCISERSKILCWIKTKCCCATKRSRHSPSMARSMSVCAVLEDGNVRSPHPQQSATQFADVIHQAIEVSHHHSSALARYSLFD